MKTYKPIITNILLFLGSLCILYFFILSFAYGFFQISFSFCFLIGGLLLVGYGLIERKQQQHVLTYLPKFLRIAAIGLLTIFLTSFLIVEGLILANGLHTPNEKLEYVIILGAGLNKDKISLSLQHRLDEAIAYHKQYQDTTFIVSGGQGINESISEAEAMRSYLVAHGIPQHQIIEEELSTSTFENFAFSKEYIKDKTQKVGVNTNSFHMLRALILARQQDLQAVGIPAKSDLLTYPCFSIREYFGIWKALFLKR